VLSLPAQTSLVVEWHGGRCGGVVDVISTIVSVMLLEYGTNFLEMARCSLAGDLSPLSFVLCVASGAKLWLAPLGKQHYSTMY